MEWYYIAAIISGSILLIVLLICVQNSRYKRFVKKHSLKCRSLFAINKRYHFLNVPLDEITYDYDHDVNFNNVSCTDYLIGYMNEHLSEFVDVLDDVATNREAYIYYKDELSKMDQDQGFDQEPKLMCKRSLLKCEKKYFNKNLLRPTIYLDVRVILTHHNMGGYYRDYKYEDIKEEQIKKYLSGLRNKNGNYYNDDFIWRALTRYERGKVSLKLRFAVFERDGYKCKCCGKHGYRSNLEIDHIIPISRGGKSTYDNLQTLCHDCNYKKGNTNKKY